MKKCLNFVLILGIILLYDGVLAESFDNPLPQGNPGAQAKASRFTAVSNAEDSSFVAPKINKDCNQNIGNINASNGASSINQTLIFKGDVINICK